MDRNQSKPTKKKVKERYKQEDVYNALDAIEKGITLRKAAEQFKVPKSTLWAKLTSVIPVEGVKGPATVLTLKEEKNIVEWLFYSSERGFPISKSQLLETVKKLVVELKSENPFKDNMPGRHWWESFCRRHPEISSRLAQNLTLNRASATEDVLKGWFQEIEAYLIKINLDNIDPSRIFNLDESAFFLVPKADKVIARKGAKTVYKVINGDEKESITVLFTVNAAGTMLPPMILFWYHRMPASIINSLPKGWIVGNTERGWMTAESFLDYIKNKFHPWLITNKIKLPVILYVDGHSSHMTAPLAQFCKANQIELIALYPNATHVLQPLDVAVFHPLKSRWKKAVDTWRIEHNVQRLKREEFAPILKTALDSFSNMKSVIKHGFQTCGLYPFNSNAVNFNILNKKKKKTEESGAESDQVLDVTATSDQDRDKEHLKDFERRLNAPVLEDFRIALTNGTFKISDSTNEGLFQYWLTMKRLTGEMVGDSVNENFSLHMDETIESVASMGEIFDDTHSLPCTFSPLGVNIIDIEHAEIVLMQEYESNLILEANTLAPISPLNSRAVVQPLQDSSTQENDRSSQIAANILNGIDRFTVSGETVPDNKQNINFCNSIKNEAECRMTNEIKFVLDQPLSITEQKSQIPANALRNIDRFRGSREAYQYNEQNINEFTSIELQGNPGQTEFLQDHHFTVNECSDQTTTNEVCIKNVQRNTEFLNCSIDNHIDTEVMDLSLNKMKDGQTNVLKEIQNRQCNESKDTNATGSAEHSGLNLSSPLKRVLVMPKEISRKKKKARIGTYLLSSDEWQNNFLRKQEEILKKQRVIEAKKKR